MVETSCLFNSLQTPEFRADKAGRFGIARRVWTKQDQPGTLSSFGMNWDAINAVSQFVSSIAVVLSVLYLGIQVHRSTRIARVAAQDAAASAVRDVTNTFMENAEMSRIWGTGLENLSTLSIEDQARFFHASHQFLKALETIHFHYLNGLMDKQLWLGWQELLRHYITAPGIEQYWKRRSTLFSARFREYIDQLDPVPDRRTVGTLLGGLPTDNIEKPGPGSEIEQA